MSAPMCPVHSVPMRASDKKPGSYYCTKKLPDGSYCRERRGPEGTPAGMTGNQGPTAQAAPVAPTDNNAAALAALAFAGSVYHGTGQGDDALAFAKRAFQHITQGG